MTATPLQGYMKLHELLLETHRDDAIFTVVSRQPKPEALFMAVPSVWQGIRWTTVQTVHEALKHPGYLTGAEAHTASLANPHLPTVLFYRSIEGLAIYGSLTNEPPAVS
jgi:hypothetical protein